MDRCELRKIFIYFNYWFNEPSPLLDFLFWVHYFLRIIIIIIIIYIYIYIYIKPEAFEAPTIFHVTTILFFFLF